MSAEILLNCWVIGDLPPQDRTFPLRIAASMTVGDLKDAITLKATRDPKFRSVAAHSLDLYIVSIPHEDLDAKLGHVEHPEEVEGCTKLHPMDQLSEHLSSPVRRHLHIIVRLPPTAVPTGTNNFIKSVKIAQDLYAVLWRKHLNSILRDVCLDSAGTSFKYVPKVCIRQLQLDHLNYREHVLLFRDEYATAFEELESREHSSSRGGGVVVIGQPGIGKSCFLFYILLRRLSAGLPTALQVLEDKFFLFTQHGASVLQSAVSANANKLPPGTWALADSNATIERPCAAFLAAPKNNIWIVQATSPNESRWYEWSKEKNASKYVIDCFSSNELIALGKLLDLNIDNLLSHFKIWGPSARTCVKLEQRMMTVDEITTRATTAAKIFVANPTELLRLVEDLRANEVSHVLFAWRPKAEGVRDAARAEIPTEHLCGLVTRELARVDKAQQSNFFSRIREHPWMKGLSSYVFQKFVHVRLTAHASSLRAEPAKRSLTYLKSVPVCGTVIPLNGLSKLREANKHPLPSYWRPTSTSFTSVNAIICTDKKIILLQSAVAPAHEVRVTGLDDIRKNLPGGFEDARELYFVFVTNEERFSALLRIRGFMGHSRWEGLKIHSCVFEIGKMSLTTREKTALGNVIDTGLVADERDPTAKMVEDIFKSREGAVVNGGVLSVAKSDRKRSREPSDEVEDIPRRKHGRWV